MPRYKTFWLRLLTLWTDFNSAVNDIFDNKILLGIKLYKQEENSAIYLLILYVKKFIVSCRMNKYDINVMV